MTASKCFMFMYFLLPHYEKETITGEEFMGILNG